MSFGDKTSLRRHIIRWNWNDEALSVTVVIIDDLWIKVIFIWNSGILHFWKSNVVDVPFDFPHFHDFFDINTIFHWCLWCWRRFFVWRILRGRFHCLTKSCLHNQILLGKSVEIVQLFRVLIFLLIGGIARNQVLDIIESDLLLLCLDFLLLAIMRWLF